MTGAQRRTSVTEAATAWRAGQRAGPGGGFAAAGAGLRVEGRHHRQCATQTRRRYPQQRQAGPRRKRCLWRGFRGRTECSAGSIKSLWGRNQHYDAVRCRQCVGGVYRERINHLHTVFIHTIVHTRTVYWRRVTDVHLVVRHLRRYGGGSGTADGSPTVDVP